MIKAAVIVAPAQEKQARGWPIQWQKSNLWLGRYFMLEREKPWNKNIPETKEYPVWITSLPHTKHKTNLERLRNIALLALDIEGKVFKLLEMKTEEFFMNTGSKNFQKTPQVRQKSDTPDLAELSMIQKWDKSSYDSKFFSKWSEK